MIANRLFRSIASRRSPRPRSTRVWIGALIACVACACDRTPEGPPRHLLLIVVDTLRVDRVGVYGYARDTTPHLDRFAEDAVRFERSYAAAPWTGPSIASMLTGFHPSADNVLAPGDPRHQSLDPLAEMLADHGFRTAAVVSNRVLAKGHGFEQGFEHYDDEEARDSRYVSSEGVTERATALLEEMAESDERFFLFVLYFDPHMLYLPHPRFGFARPRARAMAEAPSIRSLRRNLEHLSPQHIRFLRDLYDEEVAHTDQEVGVLLEGLRALGLADETLVVVTSDHGEELVERGWLGHGTTLYEELIRVPLLVRDPASERRDDGPRVVHDPVSLVSLTPTVLALLGIETDADRFQAPSLAGIFREGPEAAPGVAFAAVDTRHLPKRRAAVKRAVVGPRYKLIRNDEDGTLELYDLERDPREFRDLAVQRPRRTARLARRLEEHSRRVRRRPDESPARDLTPEMMDALRDLGYVD